MKGQSFLKKIILFSFLFFACGSGEDSLIKNILYKTTDEKVILDVEFNSLFELNLEATIPIKNYGSLRFSPAAGNKGFLIGFELNYKALEDDEITRVRKTRLLPNGQPMSRYITEDLLWIQFKKKKKIRPSLYLGSSFDNFYLGSSLELSFMDDDFPEGLTITQWVRDDQGRVLGVVTLYGPKLDGSRVKVPGGLFFATNITHLIAYAEEDAKSSILPQMGGSKSLDAYSEGALEVRRDGEPVELSQSKLWELAQKLKRSIERYNKKHKK